jgi:hypothetical protein
VSDFRAADMGEQLGFLFLEVRGELGELGQGICTSGLARPSQQHKGLDRAEPYSRMCG